MLMMLMALTNRRMMRVNMIAGRQPVLTGSSSAKVVSNQQPRLSSNFFKLPHTELVKNSIPLYNISGM